MVNKDVSKKSTQIAKALAIVDLEKLLVANGIPTLGKGRNLVDL